MGNKREKNKKRASTVILSSDSEQPESCTVRINVTAGADHLTFETKKITASGCRKKNECVFRFKKIIIIMKCYEGAKIILHSIETKKNLLQT